MFSSFCPFEESPTGFFFTNPSVHLFPEDDILESSSLKLSSPNVDSSISGDPTSADPNMSVPFTDPPTVVIPSFLVRHSTSFVISTIILLLLLFTSLAHIKKLILILFDNKPP